MNRFSVLMALALWVPVSHADSRLFQSGPGAVALVELFTSQGCSSCPPADRWLGGLDGQPGLWTQFVPVAWHVDYWDHLGWRDPFASARFSARQRAYQRSGALGVVYTPGVLVDGSEWRGWRRGGRIPIRREAVGRLVLEMVGDEAVVRFLPAPSAGAGPWRAELALLGGDLETEVARGENRGRTLAESFVVLHWAVSDAQEGESPQWRLPAPRVGTAQRRAVAAWVSRPGDPVPVQATGGWLD